MDMADEYDIGTYFSKVFRIDGGLGVIDFSMLRLKENSRDEATVGMSQFSNLFRRFFETL